MLLNISQLIFLLFLGCCLIHSSSAQVLLKLANHYEDQDRACEEFDKCMSKLAQSAENVPSAVKVVELGPNVAEIATNHFVCAQRSNCRQQQRAFCEPHMGPNGSVEMRYLCNLSWVSGNDKKKTHDPEPSILNQDDQNVACFNYEKCLETPNEEFSALQNIPHDEALGHLPKIAKQIICSSKNNCLKEMKSVCDEERLADMGHKIGKIASIFCSLVPYAEIEARNSAGSRGVGGAASLSQQVLSDVCKSPKDGVCSLA